MNLNAYDNTQEKLDKTKTWIDVKKKTIYSREIKYRKYTCLMHKYNPKTNSNSYYIAMLDYIPENKKCSTTKQDDYGRTKINISVIWKDTYLVNLKSNVNIDCELVDSDVDGEVYYVDV